MGKRMSKSILNTIGNTPMVNFSRLTKKLDGNIFAKLEYFNPGFSKKDRIALRIIEDAEKNGRLKKGQTVIELTSGSTGIGLAVVCAIKNYPFIAVMSKGNSMERVKMIKAFGGEVVLVEQAPHSIPGQVNKDDLELVEEKTQELMIKLNAFRADQFNNESNVLAYEEHVVNEVIEMTQGKIDVFVDFMGTAGSFMGCARGLKKFNPDIRCYVVEPQNAAYFAGEMGDDTNHKIQGGGYCIDLPLFNPEFVDDYILVDDEEAIATARRLAKEEGIFAGYSSGANVAAALQLLEEREKGKNIVVLIVDTGLKYMSTDLWP